MMSELTCRFCDRPLVEQFADLGMTPLSNAYVRPDELHRMEPFYPLTAYVCEACFLVQLPPAATPERIFSHYAYFSSVAESWVAHARAYCHTMRNRLRLDETSQVIEIASNDGYLLQFFKADGIPVLGIEPAGNVAEEARRKGIETRVEFFGETSATRLVEEHRQADLLLGNNVLAHVPDLNGFVEGLRIALKPSGTITMEFPHLMRLMMANEFDTIYHEHFSYFSLLTVCRVFASHGLTVVDAEELPTHGGSLRIYARHVDAGAEISRARDALEAQEREFGLDRIDT
jgi:2-polyprenyl-3-methyl-5-hydroxy-6-metoxy-1,4-benzoquinol methylase